MSPSQKRQADGATQAGSADICPLFVAITETPVAGLASTMGSMCELPN